MSGKERDAVLLAIVVFLCAVSAVYPKYVDNNIRSKRTVDGQNNCENVIQFFALKNITVPRDSSKGNFLKVSCMSNEYNNLQTGFEWTVYIFCTFLVCHV